MVTVVILLSSGCPKQAIVQAYGLDERTVAEWQQRAGKQCQQVLQAIVAQWKVQAHHVHADEIRAKGRKMVVWMGLASDATSRFWLAGVVSVPRDRQLADRFLQQVRACCQRVQALLVCTDGRGASPNSTMRAFRDKVKKTAGRGRCSLEGWPQLCIATVIKRTVNKGVVEVTGKHTLGTLEQAQQLLQMTAGCKQFNTSLIERFNGTMRQRLASLTRKCRHAAHRLERLETGRYLIGCTSNFCIPHQQLSHSSHFGRPCTPAMAAGLTDHLWSVSELLSYKSTPAPWIEPKRRGRPRKHPGLDPTEPKRPRGRPRKVA